MASAESVNQVAWWREPTKDQWYAWWAAWLGWTLDAFDFTVFLLIMEPIADEFKVPLTEVAFVLTVTLWMRLIGAVASGWLADRVGRKTPLMISILWYSLCNFIAGFPPTFLFLLRFPRAARHRHGGGMAGRRGAGDGALAAALARLHERRAARLLGHRLRAVEPGLRPVLQLHRLARHAVGRHPAGAVGVLRAQVRQRAAGLGREPAQAAGGEPRGQGAADQHLQAGHAGQHADGLLVDGEQFRPLLLADGAVRDASAEGSRDEPGAAGGADPVLQPGRLRGDELLGLVGRPFRPALGDDHPRGVGGADRADLPAEQRLHLDHRRVHPAGSLRRGDLQPVAELSVGAVPDRGARHRRRLLLSPGSDLGRLCAGRCWPSAPSISMPVW